MKSFHPLKSRLRAVLGLAVIVAAVYLVSNGLVIGQDTKSTDATTNATNAVPAKVTPEKKTPKKLSGAELYAINCNRCHAERYPTEFNSAQWQTLMLHMRVRANLPAKQAKEILKYLQEESGN